MPKKSQGFTLLEMLVALGIMALMGVMSWQGVEVLVRTHQAGTQARQNQARISAALGQWQIDLEKAFTPWGARPITWDGKTLHLTRRQSSDQGAAVVVVAWAVRGAEWMRWQSAPITRMDEWRLAWEEARSWGRSGQIQQSGQTVFLPANRMEIFFWAGNAWVNAQSEQQGRISGVRLELDLPQGSITKDWAAP